MNEALKQRLVGAGVLLILAGLLWPLLFDFDERLALEPPPTDIPPVPQVARVTVPDVARPESAKNNKTAPKGGKLDSIGLAEASQSVANARPGSRKVVESVAAVKEQPVARLPAGKEQYRDKLPDDQRARLDDEGVPISYVVQVGTFSRWANAKSLRESLTERGHKAYIKPPVSSAPGPYAVLVGPVLTAARAGTIASDVKQHFKLDDALVMRFRHVK